MIAATLTFLDNSAGDKATPVAVSYDQWIDLWKTGLYQNRIVRSLTVDRFNVLFRDDPQPPPSITPAENPSKPSPSPTTESVSLENT